MGDAAFSLAVTNGQERETIAFLVDDDTKVEGKLQAGSQATVAYRSANGRKHPSSRRGQACFRFQGMVS
ncbi:MAG TPA: hypothetical protein VF740_11755, partial [Candidatus Acidoferrum sp.]